MPSIPIARYLVPAVSPTPGDTFAAVLEPLVRGLPAAIRLDGRFDLVVYAPSGLARYWLDARPDEVVSTSEVERAPYALGQDQDSPAVPVRLVVRDTRRLMATVPLKAGLRRLVADGGGDDGARLELWIVSWVLHAGCLRGAGDYGSAITLAWRRVDQGAEQYPALALQPTLAARLEWRRDFGLREVVS